MKIVVVGTRGIPDIQGGVETHCEELYPRLAAMGHDVTVVRRSCYVTPQNKIKEYKGVRLKDIYAPRRKSIEAIQDPKSHCSHFFSDYLCSLGRC